MSAKVSRLDLVLAHITGKALVLLGKRAYNRGDIHEYRHMVAALTNGNSSHCGDLVLCTLDQPLLAVNRE